MKKFSACLIVLLALLGVGHAAPVSRNLGQGLAYHRVHQLPADLPTDEEARRQPCILDLRYVHGSGEEAATLAAWLKFHATTRAPVFVLANSDTSAALLAVIAPRGAGANAVVLGAATAEFAPDIALKVSAEIERRAYDAFEHGATADSLITEKPDKPRNDEAKLAKERQTQADYAAAQETTPPPISPAADTADSDAAAKPKPPAPPVDAVLQRAVQLHRALVALKKLPATFPADPAR